MSKRPVITETPAGFSFEFNGRTFGPYTSQKTANHMARAIPLAAQNSGMAGVQRADARDEARRFRKQ